MGLTALHCIGYLTKADRSTVCVAFARVRKSKQSDIHVLESLNVSRGLLAETKNDYSHCGFYSGRHRRYARPTASLSTDLAARNRVVLHCYFVSDIDYPTTLNPALGRRRRVPAAAADCRQARSMSARRYCRRRCCRRCRPDELRSSHSSQLNSDATNSAATVRAAVGMGIPMGIPMGMGMVWVWGL